MQFAKLNRIHLDLLASVSKFDHSVTNRNENRYLAKFHVIIQYSIYNIRG